jgi:pantoate--beta-alanine ligase
VREPDGLALSSRNVYLSTEERKQALVLSRAVHDIDRMVNEGERRSSALIEAARRVLAEQPTVRVDYLELVNWETLLPVNTAVPGTLFAVAAWVGNTRLIDNAVLR